MTRKEEKYLLSDIAVMKYQIHENNLMLRDICTAINAYLANHSQENEEDFGRNVLANLLSSGITDMGFFRKR